MNIIFGLGKSQGDTVYADNLSVDITDDQLELSFSSSQTNIDFTEDQITINFEA